MRSRSERITWGVVAVIVVGAAVVAWRTADQWLPGVGPWAEKTWRGMSRPGPDTLPRDAKGRRTTAAQGANGAAAAAYPRKCLQGATVIYTDRPCPPGTREQGVGGVINTVPQR
jgi:hypothetical protein